MWCEYETIIIECKFIIVKESHENRCMHAGKRKPHVQHDFPNINKVNKH